MSQFARVDSVICKLLMCSLYYEYCILFALCNTVKAVEFIDLIVQIKNALDLAVTWKSYMWTLKDKTRYTWTSQNIQLQIKTNILNERDLKSVYF